MHLGIAHEEDERFVRPPIDNLLSQSLADIKVGGGGGKFTGGGTAGSFGRSPSEIGRRGGRTGTRGGGIISEVATLQPATSRGMLARIGELPERAIISPESRAELAAEAEVFTPSMSTQPVITRGITPEVTAPVGPVLGEIDTTTFEGLVKGVSTVADFTRNLQKFNRARGIVPGGKGIKKRIKTSDIQNRIKFLQSQLNEGIVTEEQEAGVTDELDILNQFIQSRLGVGATRATRAKEDEQRRLDLEAIRAS